MGIKIVTDRVLQIPSIISSIWGNDPTKPDAAGTGERTWKTIYLLLCLALLAFTVYQFSRHLLFPTTGWDYQTYMSAVQTLNHQQNPYVFKNLVQYQLFAPHLAFDYPPHTLYFFWILDFFLIFHNINIYYTLLAILLLISGYLIVTLDQKPRYFFLAMLLLTAFGSTFWNFLTGNTGILSIWLFSVIFTLLSKEKYWQSSIVMGLSAAVSLFSAPFIALFLVVKRPIRDRLVLVAISTGIVVSLFIASYLINPSFLHSYFSLMLGGGSPFLDSGGWNTPTPYLLFKGGLSGIAMGSTIPLILVSCVYGCLILYGTGRYCLNNRDNTFKVLSLVMLAIFMVLPRLKPYNFIILVVPLYFLFKDCSYRIKSLLLAVIALLPFLVWSARYLGIKNDTLPFLLGSYVQAYSLIIVFLLVILHDHVTHATGGAGDGLKDPVE